MVAERFSEDREIWLREASAADFILKKCGNSESDIEEKLYFQTRDRLRNAAYLYPNSPKIQELAKYWNLEHIK